MLRPATEGTLAELIDALPATALRDSLLIIVSTRPLQLVEEAERSTRLAGTTARKLLGAGHRARTPRRESCQT